MDRKYVALHHNGEGYSRLWHEARHRVAMHLLGRLLRDPIQHRSPRLRYDAQGGIDRARRAAGLLRRRARLGDLSRLRIAGHSRLLPGPLPPPAAGPQPAAHPLGKGLAPAPTVAAPKPLTRDGPLPPPSP